MEMVDTIFWLCVQALQVVGDVTGMGYNLTNIVIFVILQPALIILFYGEKKKERLQKTNKIKIRSYLLNSLYLLKQNTLRNLNP